jgi:hypothetical protein
LPLALFALLVACWPWLFPGRAGAEGAAEVEPREVEQGASVLLRVLVDGDEPAVIDISGIADFTVTPRGRVLGTRPAGSRAAAVAAYRFELSPRRAGDLLVPSLAVTIGGNVVHTPPLRVRVRSRPVPPGDLPGQDLALDAVVSTDTPFIGEPFLYSLRLYRSRAVETAALAPPDFTGFTVVPLPGQRDSEIAVGGRHYAVAEVDYLLTPGQPGQVVLGPGSVTFRETVDPNRARGSRTLTRTGPSLAVTVRPLPPFAGPGGSSGLVERAELTARLDPPDPTQGAGPLLVATLTGQGNLTTVAPPRPILPQGLSARVLPPLDAGSPGPTGYQGSRIFRYVLSAPPPDSLSLPELVLTLFDPGRAAYVTLRAKPATLSPLTPATSGAETAPLPALPPEATRDAAPPPWPPVLAGALAGPALFLAAWLWRRRRRRDPARALPTPSALAEALRAVLERSPGDRTAARQALDRLDRLLYSGAPVDAKALEAAAREARRLLEEMRP